MYEQSEQGSVIDIGRAAHILDILAPSEWQMPQVSDMIFIPPKEVNT
jgi:hypothetical protein